MQARSAVLFNVFKLLAGTAALQVLAQLLAFATGILVVRHFSLEQYAFYTLATAMLGVATTLSDSGMRDAVMAQGGAAWQQPDRLGSALVAGLAMRRKTALVGALLVCPILMVLVLRQGGTYAEAILLCAALVPVFLATTVTPILEIPLRVHQQLTRLQLLQVFAGVVRVACVLAVLVILPVAWLAVLGGLLPQLLLNSKLRGGMRDLAHLHAGIDEVAQKNISRQVMRAMPGTLYYVLVSQVTVLLISIFGTTESVAQFGALGRLALVMTFLLAIFQLVAIPRYARIPAKETAKLLRAYLLLLLGLGAAAGLAVVFAWLAPDVVLYILGAKYASLTSEAVLAVAAGTLSVIGSAAWTLSAVRGVVVSPLVLIPPSIAVQVLLIGMLPLGAVSSMFWLSMAVSGVQAIASAAYFIRSLRLAHEGGGGSDVR